MISVFEYTKYTVRKPNIIISINFCILFIDEASDMFSCSFEPVPPSNASKMLERIVFY